MTEIGRLNIHSSNSILASRIKVKQVALTLGFDRITATRIEAVLSDLSRFALQRKSTLELVVNIDDSQGNNGMTLIFDQLTEPIPVEVAQRLFEQVSLTPRDDGKYFMRAFKSFDSPEFEIDKESIDKSVKILALPTREELLDEITRKNEELGRSRQFLQSVLENIPSTVYVKDVDGRYTFMNDKWEEETGLERDNCLGLTDMAILPEDIARQFREHDLKVIQSGEIYSGEEVVRNTDGKVRIVLTTKVPMIEDDKVTGICGISTDITDRKRVEEQIIAAKAMAEEATKAKAYFLANMSHEIRTPMNAIMGMTYLLQKTDLDSKQKDYIDKINKSSQHLLGIINDILDFSKIEAGKLVIEQIDFKLNNVLENLSNLIAEKCSAKGLELIFDIDSEISNELCGDPLRLGQILINFTNNAVKFTEKGEVIVRIKKVAQNDDSLMLRFEVQDTGIGITEEQQTKLFQSFQQADTSTTRKFGGTGLGLAISKNLSMLMGGDVGVTSRYGEGSTFWFTAMLKLGRKVESEEKTKALLTNRHVLVVDDNLQARTILGEMLRSMSFRVDEAESGIIAIDMAKKADDKGDPYEIIYMDMQMPILDGIETYTKITSSNLSMKPHCLIVTGFGREEVFRLAENAGIDLVLVKPVNPTVLYESTARIVDGNIGKGPAGEDAVNNLQKESSLSTIRGADILLVEDNEINQQVALELLAEGGFQVDVASNGAIALAKVVEKNYDIVLMDMQMPVMDGLEATRQMRKNPDLSMLPIIAMTANAMQGDKERCEEAGMNDHLAKPIEPELLFAMLLKWIPVKNGIASRNGTNSSVPLNFDPDNDALHIGNKPQASDPSGPIGVTVYDDVKGFHDELRGLKVLKAEIPGLDVDAGLKRVLGKKNTYISLLRKYITGNMNFATDLRQALDAGDMELAQRLAHTLKSVSGNIGATEVQEKAAILENGIREGAADEALQTSIHSIDNRLRPLIEALDKWLPPPMEAMIGIDPALPASPADDLMKMLEELKPHLEAQKPKKCAEVLETYKSLLWPGELQSDASELGKLTAKYRFKEALEILNNLIRKVGGGGR